MPKNARDQKRIGIEKLLKLCKSFSRSIQSRGVFFFLKVGVLFKGIIRGGFWIFKQATNHQTRWSTNVQKRSKSAVVYFFYIKKSIMFIKATKNDAVSKIACMLCEENEHSTLYFAVL